MRTPWHWIEGPWPGRLAVAARSRGGDWLDDEIGNWRRVGIDSVLSLLTIDEEADLGLENERLVADRHGMRFMTAPIRDRDVPASERDFLKALHEVNAELANGHNVLLHCRQGIGRSGLAAAFLLVMNGLDLQTAVERVSKARRVQVPDCNAASIAGSLC